MHCIQCKYSPADTSYTTNNTTIHEAYNNTARVVRNKFGNLPFVFIIVSFCKTVEAIQLHNDNMVVVKNNALAHLYGSFRNAMPFRYATNQNNLPSNITEASQLPFKRVKAGCIG